MFMKYYDKALIKNEIEYTTNTRDKNTLKKIFSLVSDDYIILERYLWDNKEVAYIKNTKNEYLHKIDNNFVFSADDKEKIDLYKIIKNTRDFMFFDIDRVERAYK